MEDMKICESRQGIKHALIKYLQYTTDRIKSAVLPLPILECFVHQATPGLQLADFNHFIECELTDSPKPNITALQGKWVKIYRYTFNHKPGKRYAMVLDYFTVLPGPPESAFRGKPLYPKPYSEDPLVSQYLKIHQQYLEKEKIDEFIDNLPSFDVIAISSSTKQPICLVTGNLPKAISDELFTLVSEKRGFLDISLDEATKNRLPVSIEGTKQSKRCLLVEATLVADEIAQTPQQEENKRSIEPGDIGSMDPEVSRGLAYLISDFTPATKRREIVGTQHELTSSISSEKIISSAPKVAESNTFMTRIIEPSGDALRVNIGVGVHTERKIEKLAQTRESDKRELTSLEQNVDLLDMLREVTGEEYKSGSRSVTSVEFERYVSWRNFHKQARSVNRKLDFDGYELASSELVEFTVETRAGTETPLIESPSKRKKV